MTDGINQKLIGIAGIVTNRFDFETLPETILPRMIDKKMEPDMVLQRPSGRVKHRQFFPGTTSEFMILNNFEQLGPNCIIPQLLTLSFNNGLIAEIRDHKRALQQRQRKLNLIRKV